VLIDVRLPQRRIPGDRDAALNANRADPYAAIDEAFGEAVRQLKERREKGRRFERVRVTTGG
jgi:hypothetical protein